MAQSRFSFSDNRYEKTRIRISRLRATWIFQFQASNIDIEYLENGAYSVILVLNAGRERWV